MPQENKVNVTETIKRIDSGLDAVISSLMQASRDLRGCQITVDANPEKELSQEKIDKLLKFKELVFELEDTVTNIFLNTLEEFTDGLKKPRTKSFAERVVGEFVSSNQLACLANGASKSNDEGNV